MGIEYEAPIPNRITADQIRESLLEGISSLGWKIVRDTGRCLSVALPDRPDTSWDEDFMVCIDGRLYVVDYVMSNTPSLLATIRQLVAPLCPELDWEEL